MDPETRRTTERLYHQAEANARSFEEVAREYDRVGMPASAESAREQAAAEHARASQHRQTLERSAEKD